MEPRTYKERMKIEAIRYIYNIIITAEQIRDIESKYPDLWSNYNLQKSLFGFNLFNGRGHKAPKAYEN